MHVYFSYLKYFIFKSRIIYAINLLYLNAISNVAYVIYAVQKMDFVDIELIWLVTT